jgi:hypothetical protein
MWQRLGLVAVMAGLFCSDFTVEQAAAQVRGNNYAVTVTLGSGDEYSDVFTFSTRARFTADNGQAVGVYTQIPVGPLTLWTATAVNSQASTNLTFQGIQFMSLFIGRGTVNGTQDTFTFSGSQIVP